MVVQDRLEDLEHLIDFLCGDVERWDEADDVGAGGRVEGPCFDEGDGEVDRGHLSFRDAELPLVEFSSQEETVATRVLCHNANRGKTTTEILGMSGPTS